MVSQPIISTKINIPSIHQPLVQRQRLFDRLDEGLTNRSTVIRAPAGYGKSTLITQWLGTRQEQAAWIWKSNDV